ncbi:MAG: hypothetical protein HYV39_01000 [Candidatus Levybacteria bacterium]|nr:hypothetical protein [Candidatus Levybacteria bacterium]
MNKFLFLPFIFIPVLLEGSVTTLPLTFCLLLIFYIFQKDAVIFPISLLAGILLDLLLVRSIGISSIFFILFLFIVFLYERKFEIETVPFVFFASFLGSLGYLWIFGYKDILLQAGVVAIFFSALFVILQRFGYELSDSRITNKSQNNWEIFRK